MNFFKKLFKRKEKEEIAHFEVVDVQPAPEPQPVPQISHKEAIKRKIGREGIPALIDAFYGTLVDREPTHPGSRKKKHLHDGWREGYSHPFKFQGFTYDVQETPDKSRALFEKLMAQLQEMAQGS